MTQDNKDRIIPISIHDEVKNSFLDYAMSVIVSRALPDVRDGLKPVHRRILYAMSEMGLTADKPHRKSARIVGEVLGKFHPHGDVSVYDAQVRMAQDFSTRYQLVDGHGNFGSLDGDPPAAMRYTEARLSKIAGEMLTDIKKETVDYRANFDDSMEEPVVLPSRYPNLLANGSSGIAVGMATNIPPHNLGEVIDAVSFLIKNPDANIYEIMNIIKGPDFPTGALVVGKEGIRKAYLTGRGIIKVQGKVHTETNERDRESIIITEIPYMQNKARLLEKIEELVKDKRIEGISELRDESNRLGERIVMEVKQGFSPRLIINQLYKFTPLNQSFGIIMLALVNGEPRVLNIKEMLVYYLEHQKEIIIRRTRYDLRRAEERMHIVEGLRIALQFLDEVIAIIRGANDVSEARKNLIARFSFTEKQAQAILDMRLQKLTALEQNKLEEEYNELKLRIKYFLEILGSEELVLKIINDELLEIKKKHGDERKTQIVEREDEINETDLILKEDVVITLTKNGYIKRMPLANYKSQKRGGKGILGTKTRENDYVSQMHTCSTHSNLLCFTNMGKVYQLKTYEIQEATRQARGTNLVNLLPFAEKEYITAIMPVIRYNEDNYLIMITAAGIIKKTSLKEFRVARRNGIIALSLQDNDELESVMLTSGEEKIIIGADTGNFIIFSQDEIRSMGRAARGVKGISLPQGARVIGSDLIKDENSYLLVVTTRGYGKRVKLEEFKAQKRGGMGLKAIKTDQNVRGTLSSFQLINEDEEFMIGTTKGTIIRQNAVDVSVQRRYAQGVTLIRVDEEDDVSILVVL